MPNVTQGVAVSGLKEMQVALKVANNGLDRELDKRMRKAGEIVAPVARRNAPKGTRSRDYRFSGDVLEDSIRTSGARGRYSVYSTAIYGGVQNYGGRVGRNHATLLTRASVSQYMSKAVVSTRDLVKAEVEGTLDWLTTTLEKR